jgi:hypothetical protein
MRFHLFQGLGNGVLAAAALWLRSPAAPLAYGSRPSALPIRSPFVSELET